MIGDEVEKQPDILGMQRLDEMVEIVQCTKARIDLAVVRDVIAEVQHWRDEERRQPHSIDAEPLQIVDAACNSLEVSLAITIGVLEGDRRNLVDHRAPPPICLASR